MVALGADDVRELGVPVGVDLAAGGLDLRDLGVDARRELALRDAVLCEAGVSADKAEGRKDEIRTRNMMIESGLPFVFFMKVRMRVSLIEESSVMNSLRPSCSRTCAAYFMLLESTAATRAAIEGGTSAPARPVPAPVGWLRDDRGQHGAAVERVRASLTSRRHRGGGFCRERGRANPSGRRSS